MIKCLFPKINGSSFIKVLINELLNVCGEWNKFDDVDFSECILQFNQLQRKKKSKIERVGNLAKMYKTILVHFEEYKWF